MQFWDFIFSQKIATRDSLVQSSLGAHHLCKKVGRLINEIVARKKQILISMEVARLILRTVKSDKQLKFDTTLFNSNYQHVISSPDILSEIEILDLPSAVKDFLKFTFETINSNNSLYCCCFLLLVEDLIPNLFIEIIKNLEQKTIPISNLWFIIF